MSHTVDVTTPSDREIRVTRVFDAPRTLVFDCHTNPELVQRWMLGPPGWSMPVCDIDLSVGGKFLYTWRSDEDGSEFSISGEHREIVPPERIVTIERFEGNEALCTLTLVENDGRTTLTQTMKFADKGARDQALETGMTEGMGVSYDRLAEIMEGQKAVK